MSNIIAQQVPTAETEWPEWDGTGFKCPSTHPEPGYESITWHCTRDGRHDGPHAAHYDDHEDGTSVVGLAWVDAP